MNAKLVTAAILAVAVLGIGYAVIADADDSSASIPDGNTYNEQTYGDEKPVNSVNMSDVLVVLAVVLIIAAACCIGMGIYTIIYGDF